jgi:hypothetical protein
MLIQAQRNDFEELGQTWSNVVSCLRQGAFCNGFTCLVPLAHFIVAIPRNLVNYFFEYNNFVHKA